MSDAAEVLPRPRSTASEIFRIFLKLGVMSFGGPIAHLGYFRTEFVVRRAWLDEAAFAELVALSQFLPGPASSQTGFGIGLIRGGFPGAAAAFAGFTAPSALLMLGVALGAHALDSRAWGEGLLHGLKLAAVAIVAQAVLGMARSLCPDRPRAAIAVLAIGATFALSGAPGQIVALLVGAGAGLVFCPDDVAVSPGAGLAAPVSRRLGAVCLGAFVLLLALAFLPAGQTVAALAAAFYRAGALVFGGGHVVLPLLRESIVGRHWLPDATFLAGYGAAQALPGPLFAFSAYLGALAAPAPGLLGAAVSLLAIFLPGLLALVGVLPFWGAWRARSAARRAMAGVNAAVVGVLAAALYAPVFTSAVLAPADFLIAAAAFAALVAWRASPLLVVAGCGAAGVLAACL